VDEEEEKDEGGQHDGEEKRMESSTAYLLYSRLLQFVF